MAVDIPQDPPRGQILIHQDGGPNLRVRLDGRTVWLSQRFIARLFHVYDEWEIGREATIRRFRTVQREGSRDVARQGDHSSLDAILAFGDRVRPDRGTGTPSSTGTRTCIDASKPNGRPAISTQPSTR